MRLYRLLLCLLPLVGLALLALNLRGHALPLLNIPTQVPALPAEDLSGLPADPEASATLDRVITSLSPPHLQWLRTDVWQRVELPRLRYQARGRYLLGPDQRFRLDLQTELAPEQKGGTGRVLLVSDGANVWSASRVGEGDWQNVSRVGVGQAPEAPKESFQGPAFGGLLPLLRNLRARMSWVRQEKLGGKLRLSACYAPGLAATLAPAGRPWPESLPKRCCLVVQGESLWPERLEWWGPAGRGEKVLAEMEFRDPVRNEPLPPADCARAFAFTPGSVIVTDVVHPPVARPPAGRVGLAVREP